VNEQFLCVTTNCAFARVTDGRVPMLKGRSMLQENPLRA
jgi:hypothetical protein